MAEMVGLAEVIRQKQTGFKAAHQYDVLHFIFKDLCGTVTINTLWSAENGWHFAFKFIIIKQSINILFFASKFVSKVQFSEHLNFAME